MASTHTTMVAQFAAILHWPLEHVIQQFRQCTPVMETARLLVTRGLTSPEPLPVPPHVGTPYPSPRIQGLGTPHVSMPAYSPPPPDYCPHSPTPSIEDITELMMAGALVATQTEADRQTPSPTGPQPGVHPGPGWEHNQNAGGIWYMFLILVKEKEEKLPHSYKSTVILITPSSWQPEVVGVTFIQGLYEPF